jgi:hypothetical protein
MRTESTSAEALEQPLARRLALDEHRVRDPGAGALCDLVEGTVGARQHERPAP